MTYDSDKQAGRKEVRDTIIREREGMGVGAIAGIIIALVLAVGLLVWAMTGNRTVARNDTTPPATTGQSAPAPAPTPAPERTPAPAPQSK
jgi:hypothetical protein